MLGGITSQRSFADRYEDGRRCSNSAVLGAAKGQTRLDVATVVGILVAFGAVALSAAIGGVDLSILYQRYEAFMLVIGGTIGATLISFPFKIFGRAVAVGVRTVFTEPSITSANHRTW